MFKIITLLLLRNERVTQYRWWYRRVLHQSAIFNRERSIGIPLKSHLSRHRVIFVLAISYYLKRIIQAFLCLEDLTGRFCKFVHSSCISVWLLVQGNFCSIICGDTANLAWLYSVSCCCSHADSGCSVLALSTLSCPRVLSHVRRIIYSFLVNIVVLYKLLDWIIHNPSNSLIFDKIRSIVNTRSLVLCCLIVRIRKQTERSLIYFLCLVSLLRTKDWLIYLNKSFFITNNKIN